MKRAGRLLLKLHFSYHNAAHGWLHTIQLALFASLYVWMPVLCNWLQKDYLACSTNRRTHKTNLYALTTLNYRINDIETHSTCPPDITYTCFLLRIIDLPSTLSRIGLLVILFWRILVLIFIYISARGYGVFLQDLRLMGSSIPKTYLHHADTFLYGGGECFKYNARFERRSTESRERLPSLSLSFHRSVIFQNTAATA